MNVTVTKLNVVKLLETSRKLGFANLQSTHTLLFGPYISYSWLPATQLLCHQLISHARPAVLHTYVELTDAALSTMDASRLREWSAWFGAVGTVLQRAATTLESLDLYTFGSPNHFSSPADFVPMLALTQLCLSLEGHTSPRLDDLLQFLHKCPNLVHLTVQARQVDVPERILPICGKSLNELDITVNALSEAWDSSLQLAESAPKLLKLCLSDIYTPSFAPYPVNLEVIELDVASVALAVAVFTEVQSPSRTPALRSVVVNLDEEEEPTEADAILSAFKNVCRARQIDFLIY